MKTKAFSFFWCLLAWMTFPDKAAATFKTALEGQSKGDTNWVSVNLQGWQELDYIPMRVNIAGGPVSHQLVTVNFDHTKSDIPGVQNLINFIGSPNVVITSSPTLSSAPGSEVWSYSFTVDVTNANPGAVQFLGRLSAGAHLFVGSSLALSSPTLQIHKPAPATGNPDLLIQKNGATHAARGATITYTISYTNIASPFNTAATGVQISDILPGSVTYVPDSATFGGVLAGNVLTWDLNNLELGSGGVLSYEVVVRTNALSGQTFTNWARIFSAENDADFSNNESRVITLIDETVVTNSIPLAINDSYSTDEDTTLNVAAPGLLSNDTDADGDPLQAILVTPPAHGAITGNANGSFTYVPDSDYNGSDSFTYLATDGVANSGPATVTIIVVPVNDRPVAVEDSYVTEEDTALSIAVPGVLANDSDKEGDSLQAFLVTPAAHGFVTLNTNGSFIYVPAANYSGSDNFTYQANDRATNSIPAVVSITVRPVNDPPIAFDDSYSTDEDLALNVTAPGVLSNDADTEGNPLRAFPVTLPAHGSLTLNTNGSFIYIPAANYSGSDSFTYNANDGVSDSAPATVNITVHPVNDAPAFSLASVITVNEDAGPQWITNAVSAISAGAGDESGQELTFIVANNNASLFSIQPSVSASGVLTFTPAPNAFGTTLLTVSLQDNGGTANGGLDTSAVQTCTIVVNPVNDPPSYTKGSNQLLNQNAPHQEVSNWASNISAGPENENNQSLLFIVTNDNNSLFSEQPQISSTGTLTYTPLAGASGIAHVAASLKDNGGTTHDGVDTSSPQNFLIQINGPPLTKIVSPTNGSVFIASTPIVILCDATDLDGTVTNVALCRGGVLTANLIQPYLYQWTNAPVGNFQFTATATDNLGLNAQSAAVNISVIDRPPLSIAVDLHFNPQTGLFEETARIMNPTPTAFSGVRLLVRGLANGATVYNASGSTNGIPYVQYNYPVPPGGSADLFLEYYVPNRIAPVPSLSVELSSPSAALNPVGTPMQIDRAIVLTGGSVLLDFQTVSNRVYYIQYSGDLNQWETAVPSITGTGSRMQWVDTGPPKTDAWPSTKPFGVYRVLQLP